MRQAFAALLLAVVLSPSFALLALAAPVPQCCLRDGAHHCTALPALFPVSGAAVQTPPCPYNLHAIASVTLKLFAPGGVTVFDFVIAQHRPPGRAQRLLKTEVACANSKRAPPSRQS